MADMDAEQLRTIIQEELKPLKEQIDHLHSDITGIRDQISHKHEEIKKEA